MLRDGWLPRRVVSPSRLEVQEARIYQGSPSTRLDPHIHPWAVLSLLRYPIVRTKSTRFRNFNRIPIAYASRPQLRGRLTLSGLAFLRKPWVYGEQVSHLLYRYSCRHALFRCVHNASRRCFDRLRNAPLPDATNGCKSTASVPGLSPDHFRR
jgi:hypothetical protein